MNNVITWIIGIALAAFFAIVFVGISAKKERCEAAGGVLVKDAIAGYICVSPIRIEL